MGRKYFKITRMDIKVPILFITFNRFETTKISFEQIAKYKPTKLFIASDGGRDSKETDLVNNIRNYILNNINWDCDVKTFFNDSNNGCKFGPSKAITWFFDNVTEGVIIEDDCVIDITFFEFCEYILPYYRNNESIFHIDAANFCESKNDPNTYHYSHYALIWGWATWSRAWKFYDIHMNDFNQFKSNNFLNTIFLDYRTQKYWYKELSKALEQTFNSWDYQWFYSIWKNNGIIIRPNINLIKNIGFDINATHTSRSKRIYQNMILGNVVKPYKHPLKIDISYDIDYKCSKKRFNINSFFIKYINRIFNYN